MIIPRLYFLQRETTMLTAHNFLTHPTTSSVEHCSSQPQEVNNEQYIAEVVIPQSIVHVVNVNSIILPIIASLTQQSSERWITWITHRQPDKASLLQCGVDLNKLRVIHVSKNEDTRWILWQALAQGNSHTVLAERSYWNLKDKEYLEEAGSSGNTNGIAITLRKGA